MTSETSQLDSFVLRFVYEAASSKAAARPRSWYVVIRHVQTNTERHFTQWAEAVEFIRQYVDLANRPEVKPTSPYDPLP